MGRIPFVLLCLASLGVHASAQSLISRESRWNYNYVFGAGGDTNTGNDLEIENTLVPMDTQETDYDGFVMGTIPGPQPYTAGVNIAINNLFEFSGPQEDFTHLRATGQTFIDTIVSGAGVAAMFTANPGNQVSASFELTRARKYEFTGTNSCPGYNNPGVVRLQRFDGVTWQNVHTTLFLPQAQGTVNVTGVLGAGLYRTNAGTSITAQAGAGYTSTFSMLLEFFPSTVTISGNVNLQDFVGDVGAEAITFEVRSANGAVLRDTIPNVPLDAAGNYSFTTAVTGTNLRVTARGRTWLRDSITGNALAENQTTTVNFTLANGDADRSGEVDAADIDQVIANFGEAVGNPAYDIDADLDGSGEVDAADIDVAIANFGESDD